MSIQISVLIVCVFMLAAAATGLRDRQNPALPSGREAARRMLKHLRLRSFPVQRGLISRYDLFSRRIVLSRAIYRERSQRAIAIAAHEIGHALQDAEGKLGMIRRLYPVRRIALLAILALPAVMMSPSRHAVLASAVIFLAAFVWSVLILPVERDATRRALSLLKETGLGDLEAAQRILTAAGRSYAMAVWIYCGGFVYASARFLLDLPPLI